MYQKLLSDYETDRNNLGTVRSENLGYQITLESLEAKILTHERNEVAWAEKYEQQDYQLKLKVWELGCKVSEIEKLTSERDKLLQKIDSINRVGLSHVAFVEKKKVISDKTGLGYGIDGSSDEVSPSDKEQTSSEDISTSDDELTSVEDTEPSDKKPVSDSPPKLNKDKEYHTVPPPTGAFQPPRPDVSSYGVDELQFRKKLAGEPKMNRPNDVYPISSGFVSNGVWFPRSFQNQAVPQNTFQNTASHSAVPLKETFQHTAYSKKPFHHHRGFEMLGPKLCHVCYSPHHLIKDCNYHSAYLSKFPKNKIVKNIPRETKPVWSRTDRVNHSNFARNNRYPHQRKPYSKPPVSSSTGKPQTVPSQRTVQSSTKKGTAHAFSQTKPNKFNTHKSIRFYKQKAVPKPKKPKGKVKQIWVKKESTDGKQPVLSNNKGNTGNMVDKTGDMEPKHMIIDHVFKDSGDYILKEFQYVTPQGEHKSVMAWVPKRN